MKLLIKFSLVFLILLMGCKKEVNFINVACGIENPIENINWIKDLVAIAETDTTGNYQGTIYLEEYLGEDVFFVQMPMGSGGVYGYWYNCDGTSITDYDSTLVPTGIEVIYSTIYDE